MDLEQKVLELRQRINQLRQELNYPYIKENNTTPQEIKTKTSLDDLKAKLKPKP